MLAALPQFGFLVAVSTANLALGFVLGRRFRIAATPLLPIGAMLASSDCEAPSETVDVTCVDGATEQIAAEPPQPTDTSAPPKATGAEHEPLPLDHPAVAVTAALESAVEDFVQIQAEFDSSTPPAAEVLQAVASRVDAATHQLLQRLNTLSDQFESAAPGAFAKSHDGAALDQALRELRQRLEDGVVQLVVLTFDDEELEQTTSQLVAALDSITSGCRTTGEKMNQLRIDVQSSEEMTA